MFVCKDCDTSFSSETKLEVHKNKKTTLCKKYINVLFYCKKCRFHTNGIKNISTHMEKCQGPHTSSDMFEYVNQEIKELKNRLIIEQVKNAYLNQIVSQSTNLKLDDVLTEKNGNLYLKQIEKCPEINIYIQDFIQTKTSNVNKRTEEKKKKKSTKYRSVDRKNIKICTTKPKQIEIIKTELLTGKESLCTLEHIFNELTKSDTINQKFIREIRLQRENLMQTISINEYVKITKKINQKFKRILNNMKLDKSLIDNCLIGSMNSIDMRLVDYKNHIDKVVDVEEIEKLLVCFNNSLIIHEEYEEMNKEQFFEMFANYSVLYFPICSLIKEYFQKNKFTNIIYVPYKKSTQSFPYSFYTLVNVNKNQRKWDMDSRLEDLSTMFVNTIGSYIIKVFRQLYYHVFNDNIYRSNFKSTCPQLENEFEQLTQNIFELIHPISFSLKLIEIVKEHSMYIPNEQNDTFNLRMDDTIQKNKYKEFSLQNEDNVEIAMKVFDDINEEGIKEWLSSSLQF